MSITVDEPEVTAKISELLSHVQIGEEVVIADAGVPIARLIAIPKPASPRIPGQDKGKVSISEDLNDPLPHSLDAMRSAEALARIRSRSRVNPLEFGLPDSTVLIQEDRNR
jgi:antitoxin (DNA-binding transcriptional repressor) of toxin-antitoxin stability system